ncbi:MAG: hypothetical protein M3O70_21615 [Actinomycetota bacterium]|nr:hypothetical protein [Actinomycetota bacterium]
MPDMAIRVRGLRELSRDLKRARPEAKRAVVVANMEAAGKVVAKARGITPDVRTHAGGSLAASYRRLGTSLKASRSAAKAAVLIPGNPPYLHGLEFGSLGGRNKRQFPRQADTGHMVYRAIGEMRQPPDQLALAYLDLLERALASVGLPLEGSGI